MITRRLPVRIFALMAAYALALQALLLGMTPATSLAGNAPAPLAVICTSTSGVDLPAGQDHAPCVPDCCVMAGRGLAGWTPMVPGIIAILAPANIRVATLQPVETLGRAATKSPQIPRAPPLA